MLSTGVSSRESMRALFSGIVTRERVLLCSVYTMEADLRILEVVLAQTSQKDLETWCQDRLQVTSNFGGFQQITENYRCVLTAPRTEVYLSDNKKGGKENGNAEEEVKDEAQRFSEA